MSALASEIGVSRQHLYNEFGDKRGLGEALLECETDRFLSEVRDRLGEHRDDLGEGLAAAAIGVLRSGARNALIRAIISGATTTDSELLELLAVNSEPVLAHAIEPLTASVCDIHDVPPRRRRDVSTIVEVMIRLTLSHLVQPSGTVERAEEHLRLTADALARSTVPLHA